jgi:hypothetical protein
VYLTLRSSRVQAWIVDTVVNYVSEELDTKITLGGLNITIFLDLVLEDVVVYDRNDEVLLKTEKMVFDLNKLSFRNKTLVIDKLLLDKTFLNIIRNEDEVDFNHHFLVEYFTSDTPRDTTQEFNWDVTLSSFEFRNSGFLFDDRKNEVVIPGINSSKLDVEDFNLLISDLQFNNDTINFSLKKFSFIEIDGLDLRNISGEISFCPTEILVKELNINTPKTNIDLNASLQFIDFSAFNDFINEVDLKLVIRPSAINISDFSSFSNFFEGIEDIINIEGDFSGRISRLRARNVIISLGKKTAFEGNITLNGLPHFDETFMNLSVKKLTTDVDDFKKYYVPLTKNNPDVSLPASFDNIGNLEFVGSFTGFINDFVAYGLLTTDVGQLSSDIVIKSIPGKRKIAYNGKLNGNNLNLGKVLDMQDELGILTFSSTLKGSGIDINDINVELKGNVHSLGLLGYDYKNIELFGNLINRKFNGSVMINDDNITLGFDGLIDYQDTIQQFDFNLNLANANLTKLNIYQRDSLAESIASTSVNMKFSVVNMENGEGDIYINNTHYAELYIDSLDLNNEININSIIVSSRNYGENKRTINLVSDIISADVSGSFNFLDLGKAFEDFFKGFMPAWFKEETIAHNGNGVKMLNGNGKTQSITPQYLEFNFDVKNLSEILNVFSPKIVISPGTHLQGSFSNVENDLILKGGAGNLIAFGNVIRNWGIHSGRKNGIFEFEFFGEKLLLTDSIWIDNFNIHGNLHSDTVNYKFSWDNNRFEHKTMGDIKGFVAFNRLDKFDLKFFPSHFIVNDSIWRISPENYIAVDSSEFIIKNFKVYKRNEFVSIEGVVSNKADKTLQVSFNRFDIYNFEVLFRNAQIDFDGFISGNFILNDVYGNIGIEADIEVKDFGFNNDHLGDLLLKSIWVPDKKAFSVNGEVVYYGNVGSNKPVVVKGYIFPEAEHDNFDLDIKLVNLRLSIFGRYLKSFASSFRGMATGDVRLEGPLAKPELVGKVRLMRTALRVDYLNVPYSFTHELEIGPGHFKFDDLQIFDTIGNSGLASGIIKHNNFREFELDVTLKPERMILLNTRYSTDEMFYGRAFATGIAQIRGPANDIRFNVSARTNRGTQLFLPVDYTGDVRENQFITFVQKDTAMTIVPVQAFRAPPGLSMNFDLEVTPDAEVQIIFDSQIGDIIRARGTGNIYMEINAQGEFAMYGDYTIQEGDYLFTLQNLINKRFRIQQGGFIRWKGDPFDADVDLVALYRVRTSLHSLLMGAADSSDVYRRRVPVDVQLNIGQTLFNPSIEFDIDLPGSDEATKEAVKREIITENELNRQVFALLVLGNFLPPGHIPDIGQGVGVTSTELLSNQLSNWLSQISSEVDIGFNYRPGDEISDQEFEMALSTQLFDDRVIIDGNFGVAGDSKTAGQNQRTSNIIGDVNVEVKVTPEGKFRVKAFNRSNSNDILNQNAPYTQGIGVFYRKEFDSFKELFQRTKKIKIEDVPEIEDNGVKD